MNFINGNDFAKFADFIIDYDLTGGNYRKGITTNILKKNAIIYCKIDYINELFNLIKFSNRKYILITHDSDYPIDQFRFNLKPPCIKKWFGKNAVIDHPDIINIPIGLENEIRHIATPKVDYPWFYENLERLNSKEKINDTVYCNWRSTHPSRNHIVEALQKNDIKIEFEKERLSHKDYCEKLSQYKYIISPQGNGVSTHRFWESLYVGSVPIVINHRIYRDYSLPFIKLNQWSDLTNEILFQFDEYKFNKDQLDLSYWTDLITEEFQKL
jgi:hypothetical protein